MQDSKPYSIELNLYNKNNPVELTRFFSVYFDTSKVNLSDERKEKIGRSNGKTVICIETGQTFYSAVQAAAHFGLSKCAVWNAIKNGKKCNGFHWKYLEDAENEN